MLAIVLKIYKRAHRALKDQKGCKRVKKLQYPQNVQNGVKISKKSILKRLKWLKRFLNVLSILKDS